MKKDEGKIEVRISPDADDRTRRISSQISDLLNSPLFAKIVLQTVEEMIIEGKLEYDMDRDLLDTPLNIAMEWAIRNGFHK